MNAEITDITNVTPGRNPRRRLGAYRILNACHSSFSCRRPLKWLLPILLVSIAAAFGRSLSGWVWMWALSAALFVGAKWISVSALSRVTNGIDPYRFIAYLFLWPGMDVRAFCAEGSVLPQPQILEWLVAIAKTLFGILLVWVAVRLIPATHFLLTGWLAMVGVVFLLHFGLFHVLSALWRSLGIDAPPIMRSPVAAASLSRFWGGKWNAAFTHLMGEHFLKPLARRFGTRMALLAIFSLSGLLHELVISVPAHGGYGLPTLYFVTQGFGVLAEHSRVGTKLGLGSGWKGWCFVVLVAGLPVFWLFNPIFVRNVILPMLHVIGAN